MANKIMENETRKFYTLVNTNDAKYGKNQFVLGRIEGFKELICDYEFAEKSEKKRIYPIHHDESKNPIFETMTTAENYKMFTELVELWYPGLCTFDIEYPQLKNKY